MTSKQLGHLKRLEPREVWTSEPKDFTPWLADRIDLLSEALGIEIELIGQEVAVGDFSVDLYGKDIGTENGVIIENQLAPTDHTHMGQLLTYGAGLDAKVIIWISPSFRDEHRQAIEWLNLHTEGLSFFGVELELMQIDDSLPAPHFKVVVQPNEWQEQLIISAKHDFSEKKQAYHVFFEDLLNLLKSKSPGYTNASKIGYNNWMAFGAGRAGFRFSFAFAAGNIFRVELYIDTGDGSINKEAFDALEAEKEVFEASLGHSLVWDRLDHRRASRIASVQEGVDVLSSETTLQNLQVWAVDELIKFRRIFEPRVKSL